MLETISIIIFTLLFLFLAWKKLDWAIYLTIVFLPIYLLRFQVWFVPMTFLEVMVLVVFVVWLIKTISRGIKASATQQGVVAHLRGVWFPWKWPALLFILAGVVAVLISPDIRGALGLWKAYILEPILFFIVFVNTIKTEKQIKAVILALGASAVLIGFGALIQYIGLAPIPSPYGTQHPVRATSIYPFPTAVGKYVGPLVALFLGLWLAKKKKPEQRIHPDLQFWLPSFNFGKYFLPGVILFGLLGLILSFSRGALIGVFAALIFVSFFSRWKKWLWLGIVLLIILGLIVPFTRHEIISVFNVKDTSADVHVVMWKGAIRIIKANPIAGTGLASFPIVYEKYKEASHVEFFPNPDHLILTLWIEMGLAGLVVFGWLMAKFFRAGVSLLKSLQTTDYRLPLVIGLMAAMIAILVHGFFDTPYFKNDLAVEFWVLVGLMIAIKGSMRLERAKREEGEKAVVIGVDKGY